MSNYTMYSIIYDEKQIYLTKFKEKEQISIAVKGLSDNNNEKLIVQELDNLQKIIQQSINQLK